MPFNAFDPNGLWTLFIGLQGQGGAGLGGTISLGLAFGVDSNGKLSFGIHYQFGGGLMVGSGLTGSLSFQGSTADNIRQLTGNSIEVGGSGGLWGDLGGSFIMAVAGRDGLYAGGEFVIGAGGSAEVHGFFIHEGGISFLDIGGEDEFFFDF